MNVKIKADTTGKYGEYGVLPALYDVEAAFIKNASGSSSKRHDFSFDPNSTSINGDHPDAFHVKDHIQSVARLSGAGQENILVFTRNARDSGDAGLYVVPFNGINSDGNAWKWASSRTSEKAKDFLYYRFDDVNHAGGVQALGSMVFVANEDDSNDAHIQILDLSNPFDLSRSQESRYINKLVINGDNGEPTNSNGELINTKTGEVILSKASSVAATRLENGKYLMFVGGRGSGKHGWFYVSDSPEIKKDPKWNFIDFWDKSDIAKGDPWHEWETINFISDAKSGDIYMVTMGTDKDKSFLYRLIETGKNQDGSPNLNFEYIDGRELETSKARRIRNIVASPLGAPLGVSTRYGAGIHITPNRNLVSYVTDRIPGKNLLDAKSNLQINEFRYDDKGMNGTDADDTILGKEENDTIYGGYGNDFLGGSSGDDLIFGGRDNDSIYGDSGVDTLHGEDGNDLIFGHTNNQEVINTLGEDNNTDYIYGGGGNDTIYGNNGDDFIEGGLGNDQLWGGRGNDVLRGDAGADTLNGGEGIDRVEYWTANAAVIADLNLGTATTTDAQGNIEQDTLVSIEQIFGSNFDDKFIGDAQENILVGGVGNDSLMGGSGNDNLRGDVGADTLDGGEGIDRVVYWTATAGVTADLNLGTATTTNAQGNTEQDTLISIEQLFGSNFNDQLIGDDQSNALIAYDGDDTLTGGKGDDILEGGSGADIFAFTAPDQGVDRINDFNSTEGDRIQISANGFGANLIAGSLNADQFVLGTASVDGNDRFIFNQDTGRLSFDADGSGVLAAVELATFHNNAVLSHTDIFVV